MTADLSELYFGAATQYYVVGRYAVFSNLTPVAGDLLHHAVEMALKGHLASSRSASDLKGPKHSLTKLWRAFKKSLPMADLKKYDIVIARFENNCEEQLEEQLGSEYFFVDTSRRAL